MDAPGIDAARREEPPRRTPRRRRRTFRPRPAGPRPAEQSRTRRGAPRRPRARPRSGRARSTGRTRPRGRAARRRGPRARPARRRGSRRAVPRQPAWTAAIQPVAASARTIGTQSAEATARRTFGWRVITASPSPRRTFRRSRGGSSKVRTRAPWTCSSLATSASGAPSAFGEGSRRHVRVERAGRQRAAREPRGETGRARESREMVGAIDRLAYVRRPLCGRDR